MNISQHVEVSHASDSMTSDSHIQWQIVSVDLSLMCSWGILCLLVRHRSRLPVSCIDLSSIPHFGMVCQYNSMHWLDIPPIQRSRSMRLSSAHPNLSSYSRDNFFFVGPSPMWLPEPMLSISSFNQSSKRK